MKKYFLTLLVALLSATGAFAQSSMLATLTHEGKVTTFYGATALKEAHAAAASGDVITLSSGTFVSTDISKGLTIRGAGMGIDSASQTEPTVITGDFTINIPDTDTHRLTLEGIYHNHTIWYRGALKNAMFLKCRLNDVLRSTYGGTLKDASFIHCRIAGELYLYENSSASCVNCAIQYPYSYNSSTSNFEFVNCVITTGSLYQIKSSSFKNCVLRATNSSGDGYIASGNTAYNCVCVGEHSNPFQYITNSTNTKVADIKSLFKTYGGGSLEKLDSETFELTDEAKTKYLSMDGTTQVGIYGGSLPFNPVPSNPQITKCNVAAKSTADGKLSVDIQINAE